MRKLATVREVKEIRPIEGAEKIELAIIDGWQCVVKKGEFNVGDLGVYWEIDSILDENNPVFEFLKERKYRIKTVKLRGALSQGLLMPLSVLNFYGTYATWNVGDDVTELTKTKLYEPYIPAQLMGVMRGNFPTSIIAKTDEERIQNVPRIINELQDQDVYITMKMDGTSFTAIKKDGELRICSRNIEFKIEENENNLYVEVANNLNLKEVLPEGYAIQGELIGRGIQGNKMGSDCVELLVFNIKDLVANRYLNFVEMMDFCQRLNFETVPLVYAGKFVWKSVDELLKFAEELIYPNGTPAEGMVIRTTVEKYSPTLDGRTSFKVISNKFLLKYGE